jgi:flagellar motor component MotA
MIAGLIDMMTRLNDPAMLGPGISISITSVLYGLTVSAVLTSVAHLLRPLSGEEIRRILGWEDILLDR